MMAPNEVRTMEFDVGVRTTEYTSTHLMIEASKQKKKESKIRAKPFVKWAGGKRWLIKNIEKYVPNELKNGKITKYVEPFVGGGSVFFYIFENYELEEYVINDACKELINTYKEIKRDVESVIDALSKMENEYLECDESEYKRYYYKKRKRFNKIKDLESTAELAALFIFLNKASFNGIFRMNSKGEYNVPVGYHDDFTKTDKENLRRVSEILQDVKILNKDFRDLEKEITKDSFVYMDPPYTGAHENNGFIEYNKKIFSWEDQKALKQLAEKKAKEGAKIMISNAKHKDILNLYSDFSAYFLSRASLIGGIGSQRKKMKNPTAASCGVSSLEV